MRFISEDTARADLLERITRRDLLLSSVVTLTWQGGLAEAQ